MIDETLVVSRTKGMSNYRSQIHRSQITNFRFQNYGFGCGLALMRFNSSRN
jgi:hypothetical protein